MRLDVAAETEHAAANAALMLAFSRIPDYTDEFPPPPLQSLLSSPQSLVSSYHSLLTLILALTLRLTLCQRSAMLSSTMLSLTASRRPRRTRRTYVWCLRLRH